MRLTTLVALLVLLTSPASAGALLFTDRAEFDLAVGNYQLFTDFPLLEWTTDVTHALTWEQGGVKVKGESPWLSIPGSGSMIGINGLPPYAPTIALTQPLTAFGLDVMLWSTADLTFTVTTANGSIDTPIRSGFIGVLSDEPLSTIWLANHTATSYGIDNLSVQSVPQQSTVVPEPATALLLLAGLFLCARFRS